MRKYIILGLVFPLLLGIMVIGGESPGFCQKYIGEYSLKKMISRMIIIGFQGESLSENEVFAREIKKYPPGGVILFDHDFYHRNQIKNIRSPAQLKELTHQIRADVKEPILIAIDQEGGKISRLKPPYGFIRTPSAMEIGEKDDPLWAKKVYTTLAHELSTLGINCDFAPVVDLAINTNNYVIVKLQRSYGRSPQKVIKYARIFCNCLKKDGVVSVLKHFPGHGSSKRDSHKGFVDITNTWKEVELEPYKVLIKDKCAEMIMVAHVFNRNLDPLYPASLSRRICHDLLRKKLGFKGVIVSDDFQMKAISKLYNINQTVRLAINAGVDMLIFANQLDKISLNNLINIIYQEVKDGNIPINRIIEANKRIDWLFATYLKNK